VLRRLASSVIDGRMKARNALRRAQTALSTWPSADT
jgi:hypothetical protein